MFADKIENCRNKYSEILVCLSHSSVAKAEWLKTGGILGHLLSPRQVESWLMVGNTSLPKEIAFEGSLEEFLSIFPKNEIARSKAMLNGILQGAVVEHHNEIWEFYSCNVAVMGCCMGEYFSIVNRKEIF